MSKIKKILCMLLVCAMVIVPCSVFGNVSAQTDDTEPLTVEVTTDKSSYNTYDIAKITVKVTNASDETVNSIVAQAGFDTLAPAGRDSVTYKEVENLQPGESFSFSYKATLNAKKFGLMNFFEKIILWFVRLFNGGYTATEHNLPENLQYISQTTDIRFGGKYPAQNVVVVGYDDEDIIELGYLRAEPNGCYAGEKTDVTFYIDISSDKIVENGKLELYIDDEYIGNLNYCENELENKVYSGTFSMFSNERKIVDYYVKYNGVKSNNNTFVFAKSKTDEEEKIINEFYADISKIKEKYAISVEEYNNKDSDAIEKAQNCYNEITSYLDKRNDISNYQYTGFNIMVMFDFGIPVGVPINDLVEETQTSTMSLRNLNTQAVRNTSSVKSKIITIQPGRNAPEFNDSIATDEAANSIINSYSNRYEFSTNLDNEAVTVETMKTLDEYDVVILESHGGNWNDYPKGAVGYIISLSERVTNRKSQDDYKTDIDYLRIIENGGYYVITERFFDYYYKSNDFDDSLIYLGTCHGGDDDVLIRDILEAKGAEAVITYKNSVVIKYMQKMLPTVFDELSNGKSAKEAVKRAKEKHGEYDPYLSSEEIEQLGFWEQVGYWIGLVDSSEYTTPAEIVLSGNNPIFNLSTEINNQGTFSAWVKNRLTDTPIEGVNVSIYLESEKDKADKNIYTYTTNEYGKIKATLPVGKYIAEFTNGMQKAQITFTIEKDVDYILQSPIYMEDNYWIICNVTDTQGNALQNVYVSVLNKGTGHEEYNVTANSGLSFTLGIGTYEITVSKDGYQSVTQTLTQPENAINRVLNITLTATGEPDTPTDDPEDDTSKYGTLTETGSCGDNAFYDFYEETGTLVIRGTGEMDISKRPWSDWRVQIKSVIVKNGITNIADNEFEFCSNLTSVKISDSVTKIGNYSFTNCYNLTNITIPDSVTSIGTGAFSDCNNLTSVKIPNTLTCIGNWVFNDCSSLTSVIIPDSVASIGDYAFSGCGNLTSITIPNSVTSIGNSAFSGCGNLTSITIPDNITSIGDSAFWDCDNLKSITIPDSVRSIGDGAFRNCSSLISVAIPGGVTSIGNSAFGDCNSLTNITVDSANSTYSNDEYGVLFNKDKTELIQYPNGNARTIYKIPNSVIIIGDNAFSNCSLTNIIIPDSVTSIGDCAFYWCYRLTSVTIPNSVTSIGNSAFWNCGSLKSITIPDSVRNIGNGAFSDCDNLTSITISNSVTNIGKFAFSGCSNLTDVYYTGTKEEWGKITIGESNEYLTNATIHYNS
ncbi:MAG: leucine-rich repeat protein [Clostridia bacterium]|nr:leucine-rich repeat protein [Clostridia bacterium]